MIETFTEIFSHAFMLKALIVGLLVSVAAALLGVNLVLKRYSMIGDGLSHVGFSLLTISVAFGMQSPLYISIPGVVIAAICLLKLDKNAKIKSDAAIALISSSALAIGVAITSLTTGMNTDICNFMFGSILAMSRQDVILSVIVSILVIILFFIYYRKLFIITFDEDFAKANDLNVNKYKNIIAVLTALIIVVGMRMMGILLISSIMIFPAITSMQIFKTYKKVIISSGILGLVTFFIGLVLSYSYNISTGAMIVIVNLIMFLIFMLIGKIREL